MFQEKSKDIEANNSTNYPGNDGLEKKIQRLIFVSKVLDACVAYGFRNARK
jgi:hypothetical protein